MNTHTATYWIRHLGLEAHPEGGHYKEVFRSDTEVARLQSSKPKRACTSIYYLLEESDYSGFHRIESDELWYFHKGSPLLIHIIDEHGTYSALELSDHASGSLSVVVKAGLWFAAQIPSSEGFTLVSCAVAPGFEFSEFEMADKQQMIAQYPQHRELLNRLCR